MTIRTKFLIAGALAITLMAPLLSFKTTNRNPLDHQHEKVCGLKGCTFKTLFGEESSDGFHIYKSPESVEKALQNGLDYLATAQQNDKGWGAGSHSYQHIMDAHAVSTDPATTAMVGMAFLRSGSSLTRGSYMNQVKGALDYLLTAVENTPKDRFKITNQNNTQIQVKLGDNIDAVLAAQFFNYILDMDDIGTTYKSRVKDALALCVERIQGTQNADGSIQGDGWAGVLQSSFANQALEGAEANDITIDRRALEKSRQFQKGNYDATSGAVNTDRGAGIALYAVSGSVRASAKEAREAKKTLDDAIAAGYVDEDAELNEEVLQEIGVSRDEAQRLYTSYQVYESAKNRAQDKDVLNGFGNNGGEEFLSYLQTGESLVIGDDNDWESWYEQTAGRIIHIQNENGSWNGHHCITSPVFCTATCLLILSVDKDIERLQKLGDS